MTDSSQTRVERDSLGEVTVPADALYGAQTARALANFPISGRTFPRAFLAALGLVKKAAALTNVEVGKLDSRRGGAIAQAADEMIEGKLDHHFPLDVFQTGSGTSTNMNANEVLATRANALLGASGASDAGDRVHPNDHVNMGQSSNDVVPTALHVSTYGGIQGHLLPALRELAAALADKAMTFDTVLKIGRTHLMDATPLTLGQTFSGYAAMVTQAADRIDTASAELAKLALGGTAVGTGLNTHRDFARRAIGHLADWTDLPFSETTNHFAAQAGMDPVAAASGAIRAGSAGLMKIANDIRWLGSGPRAGIGELQLPAVQPGSSIMPGKVNPVIAEALIMVCAQVQGNDVAVGIGASWGNFELNAMLPLLAINLLDSIMYLGNAVEVFTDKLVHGLQANRERCEELVEQSLAMVTSLAPVIGYDRAAAAAQQAYSTGQTVREVLTAAGDLPADRIEQLLDPWSMTKPGGER